jgi:hypothetical protein
MKRVFISTTIFTKRWNGLGLNDDDLSRLENYIMENPKAGDIMEGTGGAVKLRYAFPGGGKSGGARVIYIDAVKADKVFFLTCYPKSVQDTLSESEKAAIKTVVKRILEKEREGL